MVSVSATNVKREERTRSTFRGGLPMAVVLAATFAAAGCCVTRGYDTTRAAAYGPEDAALPSEPFPPRALAMFGGHTGEILTWADLLEGVRWADIVILAERHGDAVGHAVQKAIVLDALGLDPDTAVSFEMVERHEQPALDDYLAGRIDAAALDARLKADGTGGGGDAWARFYRPIADEANAVGAPVIAANAPRALVKRARLEGYAALRSLPPEERALFDLPARLDDGAYRRRFTEWMTASRNDGVPTDLASAGLTEADVEAMFRSMQMWDATMAASVTRARGGFFGLGGRRVIHLVGCFHAESDGGLVRQVAARAPLARILVVSLVPENARHLRDEDRGIADVVIYTKTSESESTAENDESAE